MSVRVQICHNVLCKHCKIFAFLTICQILTLTDNILVHGSFLILCLRTKILQSLPYHDWGGGMLSTPHPPWFLLNNLKTAYIKTFKLLHIFYIIVVNKFCDFFVIHRVGRRLDKRRAGV